MDLSTGRTCHLLSLAEIADFLRRSGVALYCASSYPIRRHNLATTISLNKKGECFYREQTP